MMDKKELTAARNKKLIEVSAGIIRIAEASSTPAPERLMRTTLGDLVTKVSGKSVATDLDMAWTVSCLALIADLRVELVDGIIAVPYIVHLPQPSVAGYTADMSVAIRVNDMMRLAPQELQDAIRGAIKARCAKGRNDAT